MGKNSGIFFSKSRFFVILICNDLCQEAKCPQQRSPQIFFSEGILKELWVSVPGIGHSDIRGFGFLLTYRSMVRRERYCLTSWITFLCHHSMVVDRSNLEKPKLLQDAFRCKYGCFAALDYPLSQRAGNVKAEAASAVRSSLDIAGTL